MKVITSLETVALELFATLGVMDGSIIIDFVIVLLFKSPCPTIATLQNMECVIVSIFDCAR